MYIISECRNLYKELTNWCIKYMILEERISFDQFQFYMSRRSLYLKLFLLCSPDRGCSQKRSTILPFFLLGKILISFVLIKMETASFFDRTISLSNWSVPWDSSSKNYRIRIVMKSELCITVSCLFFIYQMM